MSNQVSKEESVETIVLHSTGDNKPPVEENDIATEAMKKWLNAKHDAVNHPSHYTTNTPIIRIKCECGKVVEVPIECIDVIRNMPSWKGNAIKYLWREGLKEDAELDIKQKTIQDLEKAIWYIKDRIKELKKTL